MQVLTLVLSWAEDQDFVTFLLPVCGSTTKVTEMNSNMVIVIMSLDWTCVFTDPLLLQVSGRFAESVFLFLDLLNSKTCSVLVCSTYAPVETVVVVHWIFFLLQLFNILKVNY